MSSSSTSELSSSMESQFETYATKSESESSSNILRNSRLFKMDISMINQLELDGFTELFADTIEHHPDAAVFVHSQRPFRDQAHVIESFHNYIDRLPLSGKKQVLVNNSMLGSKRAMTQDSMNEHKSAGLNNLMDSEANILYEFNRKYYDKFGFPYIICVLETNKDEILSNIQKRYENDVDTETLRGIDEVKKIAKHRIIGRIK